MSNQQTQTSFIDLKGLPKMIYLELPFAVNPRKFFEEPNQISPITEETKKYSPIIDGFLGGLQNLVSHTFEARTTNSDPDLLVQSFPAMRRSLDLTVELNSSSTGASKSVSTSMLPGLSPIVDGYCQKCTDILVKVTYKRKITTKLVVVRKVLLSKKNKQTQKQNIENITRREAGDPNMRTLLRRNEEILYDTLRAKPVAVLKWSIEFKTPADWSFGLELKNAFFRREVRKFERQQEDAINKNNSLVNDDDTAEEDSMTARNSRRQQNNQPKFGDLFSFTRQISNLSDDAVKELPNKNINNSRFGINDKNDNNEESSLLSSRSNILLLPTPGSIGVKPELIRYKVIGSNRCTSPLKLDSTLKEEGKLLGGKNSSSNTTNSDNNNNNGNGNAILRYNSLHTLPCIEIGNALSNAVPSETPEDILKYLDCKRFEYEFVAVDYVFEVADTPQNNNQKMFFIEQLFDLVMQVGQNAPLMKRLLAKHRFKKQKEQETERDKGTKTAIVKNTNKAKVAAHQQKQNELDESKIEEIKLRRPLTFGTGGDNNSTLNNSSNAGGTIRNLLSSENARKVCRLMTYSFSGGPFRFYRIVFGYDPRKHPREKHFEDQMLYLKLPPINMKLLNDVHNVTKQLADHALATFKRQQMEERNNNISNNTDNINNNINNDEKKLLMKELRDQLLKYNNAHPSFYRVVILRRALVRIRSQLQQSTASGNNSFAPASQTSSVVAQHDLFSRLLLSNKRYFVVPVSELLKVAQLRQVLNINSSSSSSVSELQQDSSALQIVNPMLGKKFDSHFGWFTKKGHDTISKMFHDNFKSWLADTVGSNLSAPEMNQTIQTVDFYSKESALMESMSQQVVLSQQREKNMMMMMMQPQQQQQRAKNIMDALEVHEYDDDDDNDNDELDENTSMMKQQANQAKNSKNKKSFFGTDFERLLQQNNNNNYEDFDENDDEPQIQQQQQQQVGGENDDDEHQQPNDDEDDYDYQQQNDDDDDDDENEGGADDEDDDDDEAFVRKATAAQAANRKGNVAKALGAQKQQSKIGARRRQRRTASSSSSADPLRQAFGLERSDSRAGGGYREDSSEFNL